VIGHYLLTLTPEQEERVLTGVMGPIMGPAALFGNRCLVVVAHDLPYYEPDLAPTCRWGSQFVGLKYDDLCERFTTERVNAAIRNRILSNQARRALSVIRLTAHV
jgi:hypothetical protein